MILFKQAIRLQPVVQRVREQGGTIGFVPTMGALHAGHLSLVEAAKKKNSLVICSIFVNPTQFNDPSDFDKYPITLEKDIEELVSAGTDMVFLPSVSEIYPEGTTALPTYPIGFLETILEGKYRPGHFQGVCQVMHRLLQAVQADDLFMGQKDYQQCMVVQQLLDITGIKTRLHTIPTLRETDGLAMSSRNLRLPAEDRRKAVKISEVLSSVCRNLQPGVISPQLKSGIETLENTGFRVDYLTVANATTLKPIENWDGREAAVVLTAAYMGNVRLIDNMLIPVRK